MLSHLSKGPLGPLHEERPVGSRGDQGDQAEVLASPGQDMWEGLDEGTRYCIRPVHLTLPNLCVLVGLRGA